MIDLRRLGRAQLDLLTYLSPTPASIHDLAADLGISTQAVRQRIHFLRDAGIHVELRAKRASLRRWEFPAIYEVARAWLESREQD